jgi:mono/diheme cytochrome c family protein
VKRVCMNVGAPLAAGVIWILSSGLAAQSAHGQSAQVLRHGQQTFVQYCSSCHSAHNSNSLVGLGLKGYYSTHHPRPTDPDVRAAIIKGKGKMPAFGNLSTIQVDELIAYLRTL